MVRAESLPQRGCRSGWIEDRRASAPRQWVVRGRLRSIVTRVHRGRAGTARAKRVASDMSSSGAAARPDLPRHRVDRDRGCQRAPPGRGGRVGLRRVADGGPCPGAGRRAGAAGGIAAWAAADLTAEAEVDAAVAAAVARFGRIDGLFAVAGGSGRRFGDGPIHELSAEGWDRTLELDLRSQALTCRAVVRQMLAQEPNGSGTRGSILLMGSVTASDPAPSSSPRTPMPRQGRDDGPDDDDGRDLRCARGSGSTPWRRR